MIINSLFLQSTESSGGGAAMNALGMQKSDSAGYLFSDIMKVHLGSETTGEAGLSETNTGGSGVFSGSEAGSLLALIQNLMGNSELPEELKSLLENDNLLTGELNATSEELENILASLINQPNVQIYGIDQISGEAVELNNLEEIKNYLAENKEIFISAEGSSNSLKINLSQLQSDKKTDNIMPIKNVAGNEDEQKKFKISFNFEKTEKPSENVSGEMQSKTETGEVIKNENNEAGIVEKVVKAGEQKNGEAKITNAAVIDSEAKSDAKTANAAAETATDKTKQNIEKNGSEEKSVNLQSASVNSEEGDENTELKNNVAKSETKSATTEKIAQNESSQKNIPVDNSKSTMASNEQKAEAKSAKATKEQSENISAVNSDETEVADTDSKEGASLKSAETKGVKEKVKGKEKVSPEAVDAEVETKQETKVKSEQVNVAAKKSVKSDNVNVNGKPIVTNNETKTESKPETTAATQSSASSDTAANMGTDSDSTNFGSPEDHKSSLANMRNSNQEVHHSTKFTDLVNEKINKEQFLIKPEATKIVKAAELVKEISKYIQTQDKNSLTINLDPEHLGKVKIMMEVTDKVVKAHIEVDNEVAKHMVETNIKDLQTSTQKNGLELGQVNISLSNTEQKNQKHFADKNKNSDKKSNQGLDENIVEDNENQQIKNLGYNTMEYVA